MVEKVSMKQVESVRILVLHRDPSILAHVAAMPSPYHRPMTLSLHARPSKPTICLQSQGVV